MRIPQVSRLLPVLIVAAIHFPSYGYFPDSTFLPYADSLFALDSDTQITARRIKKDAHTYFMVTTCKTIQHPYPVVVSKLQQFKSYPDYFTFIMKVAEIDDNTTTNPVTMFVGHYGLYRVYFFGKIREEYSPDSGRYRVFCGGVEQKKYRKAWRRRVRGLIKIGSWDVDIFWTVEKRGTAACRVSLTASQAFTTRIPNWMISIGTNRIFRGMLNDLEKYIAKTAPPPPPDSPTPENIAPAAPADSSAASPATPSVATEPDTGEQAPGAMELQEDAIPAATEPAAAP
jgi:hypothetical protein